MDSQPDFDLGAAPPPDEGAASFDHYLLQKKMRHSGARPDTRSKTHSEYDWPPPDVFIVSRTLHIKHRCASLHTH
jgi:hypothetical protein